MAKYLLLKHYRGAPGNPGRPRHRLLDPGRLLPLLLVHLARPTPCSLRPNQGRSTGCYDVRPDLVLIP